MGLAFLKARVFPGFVLHAAWCHFLRIHSLISDIPLALWVGLLEMKATGQLSTNIELYRIVVLNI